MLLEIKTGKERDKLWEKSPKYCNMLAKINPNHFVIGEVKEEAPEKEAPKPAAKAPEKEAPKQETKPRPKKRGPRPTAKK